MATNISSKNVSINFVQAIIYFPIYRKRGKKLLLTNVKNAEKVSSGKEILPSTIGYIQGRNFSFALYVGKSLLQDKRCFIMLLFTQVRSRFSVAFAEIDLLSLQI